MARAIENQAFVIGVNRVGEDGNGIDHSGDSAVVAPGGRYVAALKAGMQDFETITLSVNELFESRQNFQAGKDWDDFLIIDSR
jgi:predicted amidohydrolase